METQLVTTPELTFEPSYGSKYGKESEKKKKQRKKKRPFVFFMGGRKLIAPGSVGESLLFQDTLSLWWCCWVPALCHIPLQSGTSLDNSKEFL